LQFLPGFPDALQPVSGKMEVKADEQRGKGRVVLMGEASRDVPVPKMPDIHAESI
jgi:hypothetical protein